MELTDQVIEVGDTVEVVWLAEDAHPAYMGQRGVVTDVPSELRVLAQIGPVITEEGPRYCTRWDRENLKVVAKGKDTVGIIHNPGRAEPIYGSVSDEDKRPENLTSDTHSRGGPVSDIGLLWAAIDELRQSNRDRLSEIGRLVGIAEALLTPPAR